MNKVIKHRDVLTMPVAATSIDRFASWTISAVRQKTGHYVCVSNVHMCMEACDNPPFSQIIRNASVTVPDGKPIVWAMRLLGENETRHIRGSDLMVMLCRIAEKNGTSIGLYGGTPESLTGLMKFLHRKFPDLKIPFAYSPPFRPLSSAEDIACVKEINDSEVGILFVGLGCPKQEKWMAEHVDKVRCVMLGVGAAFDFFSGQKRHAPRWMQRTGLEWAFRFISEPRRLWKRYLKHNPRFIWYFTKQLLGYDHNTKRWNEGKS